MIGTAFLTLALLADAADDKFLTARVHELAVRYDENSRRQTDLSVGIRAAVVRELAHLPFSGNVRGPAGLLLVHILQDERSYRVRADAVRAVGRVGTAPAMRAAYHALFGQDGRSRKFELMYAVLPEALSSVRHADDIQWLSRQVLDAAGRGRNTQVLREAGPLRDTLVALTLDGVRRGRIRALAPECLLLASDSAPEIRAAALEALVALDAGADVVVAATDDKDEHIRAAAFGFRRLPLDRALRGAADHSLVVRRATVRGLAKRPPSEAVPILLDRLAQELHGGTRLDILDLLHKHTGKDFGMEVDLWEAWWAANARDFKGPRKRDKPGHTYFFAVGLRTRHTVFVLDVSSSMRIQDERGVSRHERAARELGRTLTTMPKGARFTLLAFAAAVRRFPDGEHKSAVGAQAAAAVTWFRKLRPAGATNTFGALMIALRDSIGPDTIVLLSDGNPYRCSYQGKNYSEHEQILAEVRRANRDRQVRIHTVALLSGERGRPENGDTASAADFLRRLAGENRGESREVR